MQESVGVSRAKSVKGRGISGSHCASSSPPSFPHNAHGSSNIAPGQRTCQQILAVPLHSQAVVNIITAGGSLSVNGDDPYRSPRSSTSAPLGVTVTPVVDMLRALCGLGRLSRYQPPSLYFRKPGGPQSDIRSTPKNAADLPQPMRKPSRHTDCSCTNWCCAAIGKCIYTFDAHRQPHRKMLNKASISKVERRRKIEN